MRFLVDMPLSLETAVFLRRLGHDAVHARDLGMQRAADSEIVDRARREQRIVITMDVGFGELLAFASAQFPSLILLRLEDARPENVEELLKSYLPKLVSDLDGGAFVTISDKKVRVRRLPIEPNP